MPGRRASLVVVALALVGCASGAAVPASNPPPDEAPTVRFLELADRYLVANDDGTWTIFKRCETRRRTTVGPGYVAQLVSRGGITIVDDVRRRGTLNDPEFGGLGAFGWHHARGRPNRLRFRGENAWEVSGRVCATANRGFGVVASAPERVRRVAPDAVELGVAVLFSDVYTYPRPLLRVRYRYRFERDVVKSWIEIRPLCSRGRCGRTRSLAFVKEPKLVAHVVGGGFTRMSTWEDDGRLACVYVGGGGPRGPILDTGQCAADRRSLLRFDYGSGLSGREGGCATRPCLNVVMRAYAPGAPPGEPTEVWEGAGLGLDGWAVNAARRPRAFARDTGSIDGVVWNCHGATPDAQAVRRWETTGRLDPRGRYLSLGGLFPAWEGGRGGYDCEPLARAFPPAWDTWSVFASYSLGDSWPEFR